MDEFTPHLDDEDDEGTLEERVAQLNAALSGVELSADIPPVSAFGPDFRPQILEPIALPSATAANMVCLRGPCRHYVQVTVAFPAGNTADSLGGKLPKQHTRFCTVLGQSGYIDLTDECPLECNRWDPELPEERHAIEQRRDAYRIRTKEQSQ